MMLQEAGVRIGVQYQSIRRGHCSFRMAHTEVELDHTWFFDSDICSKLSGCGLPGEQHRHSHFE